MSWNEWSRRRTLTASGTALAAALAGCTGDAATDDGNDASGDEDSADDDMADGEGTESDQESTGDESGAYSVSMAPVGEVEFDSVPERWLSYFPGYADMGVALGRADGLIAIGNRPRYHTQWYDELDGVSVDRDELTQLIGDGGIDKEIYYELDVDVHLTDPEWLINNGAFSLDEDDVEEIGTNVAPFVGNAGFRRTDPWHDYRYYSLYESFEKVAELFQATDRYEAFESFHDEYLERVQSKLPAEEDRPNALLTFGAGDEPEQFSPYRLADEGTNKKQWHDLGIADALDGTGVDGLSTSDRGRIDYETMLDVDPDVVLIRGHEEKSHDEFADTVLAFMEDHDVASDLTAVQNGRVFRGGPIYQGPIQHLFTLERAATELFPDTFEGELFDRDRVANIVAGDV